jgi:hypothetical protein
MQLKCQNSGLTGLREVKRSQGLARTHRSPPARFRAAGEFQNARQRVISPKAVRETWTNLLGPIRLDPQLWQTAQEAVIQITPVPRNLAENACRVLKINFNLEMHHGRK